MLFSYKIDTKNNENIQSLNRIIDELMNQCRDAYDSPLDIINGACDKADDIVDYLNDNFTFFDKSVTTTYMCSVFAVLYANLTKIVNSIPISLLDELELEAEVPEMRSFNSIKELRNNIDNWYKSPKKFVETDVIIPLNYIKDVIQVKDTILDIDDCLYILVLLCIVYSDITFLVSETNTTHYLLGKDYKIDVIINEDALPENQEAKQRELEEEKEKELQEKRMEQIQEIFKQEYDEGELEDNKTSKIEKKEEEKVKKDDKSDTTNVTQINVKDDEYGAIVSSVYNITKSVDTYKEIRDSIKVDIPDEIVRKTSDDMVKNIKKAINDNVNVYLVPIEKELRENCDNTLELISTLEDTLNSYIEYIKNIQKEFKFI